MFILEKQNKIGILVPSAQHSLTEWLQIVILDRSDMQMILFVVVQKIYVGMYEKKGKCP